MLPTPSECPRATGSCWPPALVLEGLGALERLDDRVLEESMRSTTPALVN